MSEHERPGQNISGCFKCAAGGPRNPCFRHDPVWRDFFLRGWDPDTALYLIFETDDSPRRDQAFEWLHNYLASGDDVTHLLSVQDIAEDMLDRVRRNR